MIDLLSFLIVLTVFSIFYLVQRLSSRTATSDPSEYATFLFSKDQYHNSPQWAARRRQALEDSHYSCDMCHSTHNLDIHYISYASLYHERPQDIAVVCPTCHDTIHQAFGHPSSIEDYSKQYPLLSSYY